MVTSATAGGIRSRIGRLRDSLTQVFFRVGLFVSPVSLVSVSFS